MPITDGRVVWAISGLVVALSSMGAERLVLTQRIVGEKYCRSTDGSVVLTLAVDFEYHNASSRVFVLPRFSRVSSYALYGGERGREQKAVVSSVSHLGDIFSVLEVNPSAPPTELFEPIPPNGVATRKGEVAIPLTLRGRDGRPLVGRDLYIAITLDNWPGRRHLTASRRALKHVGTLWDRSDVAPPVPIHVEEFPTVVKCTPRVD